MTAFLIISYVALATFSIRFLQSSSPVRVRLDSLALFPGRWAHTWGLFRVPATPRHAAFYAFALTRFRT